MTGEASTGEWFHDPDWKTKNTYHSEKLKELRRIDEQYDYINTDREIYKQHKEASDMHLDQMLRAFVSQFPTAADYAAYMLKDVEIRFKRKLDWVQPNLNHIKTEADAIEIYSHTLKKYEEMKAVAENSPPVDYDSPIFKANNTQHYKLHVDYHEHVSVPLNENEIADFDIITNSIASVETLPEKARVCLFESSKYGNRSVTNGFDKIATLLYHGLLKDDYNPDQIEWYLRYDPRINMCHGETCPISLSLPSEKANDLVQPSGDWFIERHNALPATPHTLLEAEQIDKQKFLIISPDNLNYLKPKVEFETTVDKFYDTIKEFFRLSDKNKSDNSPKLDI